MKKLFEISSKYNLISKPKGLAVLYKLIKKHA